MSIELLGAIVGGLIYIALSLDDQEDKSETETEVED